MPKMESSYISSIRYTTGAAQNIVALTTVILILIIVSEA